MIIDIKDFTREFRELIQKEIESNKAIQAEITDITGNVLEVYTKYPVSLAKNMAVEVNRVSAKVVETKNKKILLDVTKSDFYLNQNVMIKNIQNDIIIHKLQETLENISDSNINRENKETLNVFLDMIEPSFTDMKFKVSDKLNYNQKLAVKHSLQADKFHIIKGPPGTGKTHTIIEIINKLHKNGKRILITAHTHIALDNIIERLDSIGEEEIVRIGFPDKISPAARKYALDEQIKHHRLYDEILENERKIEKLKECPDDVECHVNDDDSRKDNFINKIFRYIFSIEENENSLNNYAYEVNKSKNIEAINDIKLDIENIRNIIQSDILKNAKIIASTVLSSSSFLTKDMEFDYVIMDEASQVPLYLSLIPLMKTDKFILIGDDKQLQPIQNKNSSPFLNKSVFNLLIEKYPDNFTFLNVQYRMNQEISDVSSRLYYDAKLLTGEKVKNQRLELKNKSFLLLNDDPITFIDTSNVQFDESDVGGGCCNKYESFLIVKIIRALLANDIKDKEIGVITPYKKQKLYIQKLLVNEDINVEVDTIYRFQGREKDVILLSFCKSSDKSLTKFQESFLANENQLNVSITRSRKKLVIIGNYDMLSSSYNIRNLLGCISPMNVIYLEEII